MCRIFIVLTILVNCITFSCVSSNNKDSSKDSDNSADIVSNNLAKSDTVMLITQGIPGKNIPCYWIYLPENNEKSNTLPILIFLHGGGIGKEPDLEGLKDNGPLGHLMHNSELNSEVKELIKKFIILNPVLPENPDNFTLWDDNIDALDAIIDSVISCYKGDPSRLYSHLP